MHGKGSGASGAWSWRASAPGPEGGAWDGMRRDRVPFLEGGPPGGGGWVRACGGPQAPGAVPVQGNPGVRAHPAGDPAKVHRSTLPPLDRPKPSAPSGKFAEGKQGQYGPPQGLGKSLFSMNNP